MAPEETHIKQAGASEPAGTPSRITVRSLAYTILVLAIVGLIDAVYLTTPEFTNNELFCGSWSNCEKVTTSEYSTLFGIHLSVIGVLYYAAVAIMAFLYLVRRTDMMRFMLVGMTLSGFLASVYFVYLQLFVIEAICIYCMISAVNSTLLFAASIVLSRKHA